MRWTAGAYYEIKDSIQKVVFEHTLASFDFMSRKFYSCLLHVLSDNLNKHGSYISEYMMY